MESQLPEANFVGGHVSLLSGIGIQIDNIQSSQVYAITSDLPRLFLRLLIKGVGPGTREKGFVNIVNRDHILQIYDGDRGHRFLPDGGLAL